MQGLQISTKNLACRSAFWWVECHVCKENAWVGAGLGRDLIQQTEFGELCPEKVDQAGLWAFPNNPWHPELSAGLGIMKVYKLNFFLFSSSSELEQFSLRHTHSFKRRAICKVEFNKMVTRVQKIYFGWVNILVASAKNTNKACFQSWWKPRLYSLDPLKSFFP